MTRETRKTTFQGMFKIWLTAALLLASALAASAQEAQPTPCDVCPEPTVRITGTVRDCAGAPLAGVPVRIIGDFTGTDITPVTNASGFYNSGPLPADSYAVFPTNVPTGFFYSPRLITTTGGVADFTRYRRDNRANFDGDCRTDVSDFHRGNGWWRFLRSSDNQLGGFSFGTSGDIAAPGDYDGDGRTDGAVFRPGNGTWYIRRPDGTFYGVPFGQAADIPVARDYDGDGETDIAVFRPGNGTWYIMRSDFGDVTVTQFGASGDRVVPGDYDGDNKDDIAVFRPSDATWYVLRSSDGTYYSFQFGVTSDWPAQADYDGDGRTDAAVFRPGPGDWHILYRSNGGVESLHWGQTGDRPAPGDYDGDGRANVAVQRPDAAGVWWILLNNQTGAHVGVTLGDPQFPVPAGYLTPLF